MVALIIRSEADAWTALKAALDGEFDKSPPTKIEFKGWPTFKFDLDIGEASLRPVTMRGLLALHQALERSFALTKYGEPNLQKLTDDDKAALEFDFKVRPGSTKLVGDPKSALVELAKAAGKRLKPKHYVIMVLAISLMYFGNDAWKGYLQNRLEMRRDETQSKEKLQLLETFKFLSANETARAKIMERAIGAAKNVEAAEGIADEARRSIVKSIPEDAVATLSGTELPGIVAKELAKNPRNESRSVILQSRFKVLKVDTTSADGFRVRLHNLRTGEEITAHLRDALVSEADRDAIEAAEWSKKAVYCRVEIVKRGEKVIEAVIKGAAPTEKGLD